MNVRIQRIFVKYFHCKMNFSKLFYILSIILFTFFTLSSGFSQDEDSVARKKVRVGYFIAPGFQEFDSKTNTYSGSGYEFLMALQQYTSWNLELVPVHFTEGLEMLRKGELDLMNNVSKTEEREKDFLFSLQASGSNYGCICVSKFNDTYAYNDFSSFNKMKVGLIKNSVFEEYFDEFCKIHNIHPKKIIFENDAAMTKGLRNSIIDARIVSSSYNDSSRVVARFSPMDYFFVVPKSEEDLYSELNDAMANLQSDIPGFAQSLLQRYQKNNSESILVLSNKEKEFVKNHPSISVSMSLDWYPLLYSDTEGVIKGPVKDLYNKIEEISGLHFVPVICDSIKDSMEEIKFDGVDMIAHFPFDFVYAADSNIRLSDQIFSMDVYQVLKDPKKTNSIKTIALYGDSYIEEKLVKMYGQNIDYIMYSNIEDAVNAVKQGSVDCTFVNYYSFIRFQNIGKYVNLKYVLIASLRYPFCLGISNAENSSLQSIINKSLHVIGNDSINSMFQSASSFSYSPDLRAQFYHNSSFFLFLIVLFVLIIVVLFSLFFYSRTMIKKNMELEKARQSQSNFLSRMSHDMRTPMNGIMGLAALSFDEKNIDVLRENIKRIKESGDYLLSLINDTLDFQRIESGKMVLEKKIVSAKSVLDGVVDVVQEAIRKKNIKFNLINDNVNLDCFIRIDSTRFKQIFINLLSNSIKFTPENGTITFQFGCLKKEEMVSHIYIKVIDNGIGMSEDFINKKLFKPFSQENNAVSTVYAGSGLGLSIVKSLVDLMDGKIKVSSTLGQGTNFTVFLDFERISEDEVKKSLDSKKEQLSNSALNLGGKKILLVEDNPLNAEIASRLLKKAGCEVEWSENGEQGVKSFEKSKLYEFDIVLMDIRMPVMDGIAATKAIRNLEREDSNKTPIIAMTANAYEEDVRQCLQAGMNAHISKPIVPSILFSTIGKFCK